MTCSPDNDVSADSSHSDRPSDLARRQQTLEDSAEITGFGYWSGQDVTLQFRPAASNTGIVFVREDLSNFHRIPVNVFNRVEVPRRTNLARYGISVEMVEHVVAALAGLQIDNCEIWTSASELPGCDGSSQPFVDVLLAAGIIQQDAWCQPLVLHDTTRVGDDDSWVLAQPLQEGDAPGSLLLNYQLDYGSQAAIGRQSLEIDIQPDSFIEGLAAARTFILESEAEWLQGQGLGSRVTCQDLLVFASDGPVDNELRFHDECVRHKTLDLLGDLALAGCQLSGRITASRSGHRLNAELVRALLKKQPTYRNLLRVA